jgi:hypothetical protein
MIILITLKIISLIALLSFVCYGVNYWLNGLLKYNPDDFDDDNFMKPLYPDI